MATAQRQANGSSSRRVLVSNTAANMVSSLHPFDKAEADAVLATNTSSVLDPAKVEAIAGVDNAFVARALTLVTFDELYADFDVWLGLRKMDRAAS